MTRNIPLDVKSTFDPSEALDAHVAQRIEHALRPFAHHVKRVEVRLWDENGPRGGDDKIARIAVSLDHPSGEIITTAAASDIYDSVTRAAARAGTSVARRVERAETRTRQAVHRTA
jgi:putative sigma-54 modulation protein